jgi:hypothetical protein
MSEANTVPLLSECTVHNSQYCLNLVHSVTQDWRRNRVGGYRKPCTASSIGQVELGIP